MRENIFIELLSRAHNREQFDCGEERLNDYIRKQATQDMKKHMAAVYVAMDRTNPSQSIGFYTLSAAQIIFSDLPNEVAKSLPRYPNVPAYRIGRLAVDKEHQGKGIGAMLLMDALFKCLNKEIPVVAVIVDAKNNHATDFYKKYGFIQFPDQPLKLFIPVKVIKNTFVK